MQLQLKELSSQTYSAGATVVVPLRSIPTRLHGRFVHLAGILFDCDVTPTFTTAPTVKGVNNLVTSLEVWDGKVNRFAAGGFNALRIKEMLATGHVRQPDPDADTASGTARYFRRIWTPGPQNFMGNPSDFAIPAGLIAENGEIRMRFGAVTDLSGDTTAATGTVRVVAVLALYDELRIPPAVQCIAQALSASSVQLPGRALYLNLAMANDSAFGGITAGDFDRIRVDMGFGEVVSGVTGSSLTALYHELHGTGDSLGAIQGEPRAASDDNTKSVNRSSPTAISASAADVQPVLFSGKAAKLSKCHLAESQVSLSWSGSQSSGVVISERVLEQPHSVVGELAKTALQACDIKGFRSIAIKTGSKKEYSGPLKGFFPWAVKV